MPAAELDAAGIGVGRPVTVTVPARRRARAAAPAEPPAEPRRPGPSRFPQAVPSTLPAAVVLASDERRRGRYTWRASDHPSRFRPPDKESADRRILPIANRAGSTTCASPSPTAATCAARTACRRRACEARAHDDILSYEELAAFARVAADVGISKVRITGGEPLVRLGCADFVGMLSRTSGIDDISLTTNGVLLPKFAADLRGGGPEARQHQPRQSRRRTASRASRAAAASRTTLAGIDAAFAAGLRARQGQHAAAAGRRGRARRLRRRSRASATCTCASSSSCRSTGASPATTSAARPSAAGRRPAAAGSWSATCSSRHDGPYGARPRAVLEGPGRARHHRLHRRRVRALLRELQPPAPDGRRPPAHLPVLGQRGGRPAAARRPRGPARRRSRPRSPARRYDRCSEALANDRSMSQIGG